MMADEDAELVALIDNEHDDGTRGALLACPRDPYLSQGADPSSLAAECASILRRTRRGCPFWRRQRGDEDRQCI